MFFFPVIVHVLFFHKLTNSKDQKVLHQLNFDDDQALTVKVVNIGGASASGGRMDDEVCLLCCDRRYAQKVCEVCLLCRDKVKKL